VLEDEVAKDQASLLATHSMGGNPWADVPSRPGAVDRVLLGPRMGVGSSRIRGVMGKAGRHRPGPASAFSPGGWRPPDVPGASSEAGDQPLRG
jgi:hypothetical protein